MGEGYYLSVPYIPVGVGLFWFGSCATEIYLPWIWGILFIQSNRRESLFWGERKDSNA